MPLGILRLVCEGCVSFEVLLYMPCLSCEWFSRTDQTGLQSTFALHCDAGNVAVAKALLDSGVFRSLVAQFAKRGGDEDAEPLRCGFASLHSFMPCAGT